ncbi:MAG TPA: porin [Ignavibacteriaceae bacterium]|nr:porin [Ignavibacteriaceae bacterium]
MKKSVQFLLIIFFLTPNCKIFSQVEFTGYGSTGIQLFERPIAIGVSQEVYFEGKLQAEIKVNKDIEAQLDFRGNSADENVELREFSAKFEYWERMKIEIGNLKQPFGIEQMISDEDFELVDGSFINQQLSDFGYAERSVSVMFYSKYKDEYKNYPFSYYLSLFKNNSLTSGLYARLSYHDNNFIYSVNYSFHSIGGDYPVKANAFCGDITFNPKNTTLSIEAFYVKNTETVLQNIILNGDQNIFAAGAKFLAARVFDIDGKIIKGLEPALLFGYFTPDIDENEFHTLQIVPGINVYFHDKVRLRLNYNKLLTKNRFNEKYSSLNTVGTLEVQVRF